MRELKDLPNKEGFIFTGITKKLESRVCIVLLKDGKHTSKGLFTPEPDFSELYGWETLEETKQKWFVLKKEIESDRFPNCPECETVLTNGKCTNTGCNQNERNL
jgi:hypothetical protein